MVLTNTVNGPRSAVSADLDGDGDMDIVLAAMHDHRISWFENNGASPPVFSERIISDVLRRPLCVHARDVDGDGDLDLLTASEFDNRIAWFENQGGAPLQFAFHTIDSSAEEAQWVFTEDVDGDGFMDVGAATFGDDRIAWHRNLGDKTFAGHDVVSNIMSNPRKMAAAHMDDDPFVDLVVMSSYRVVLLKNDGAIPPSFEVSLIANAHALAPTAAGLTFCFQWPWCRLKVVDVNKDGHPDVFVPGYAEPSGVYWFENHGGSMPTFTARVLEGKGRLANALDLADLDGDDDIELLWGSEDNPDWVAYHENFYGMLPTPSHTPTPSAKRFC